MNISFNWLKQYIDLTDSVTAGEVAAKLKAATVEVEGVVNLGADLAGVVVGKVISAEKHPNADKLKLCQVDVGNERIQIVCGGSNVRVDMLVALAKVGAKVRWHGEGDLVELKPTAIRGVESFGMICASTEIGLGERFPLKEEKEILDLTNFQFKPGTPLAEALGLSDSVLEIDNKTLSHRPDLWGHYGIAREVAVLFKKKLAPYKTKEIKAGKDIKLEVVIEDKKLCPRYMAVAISGVTVGPSPAWLQEKLLAVGLRPINNIVDITNYISYDLGQPMHAFDLMNLKSAKIIVRRAKNNEKFVTLDEKENILDENMLVVADEDAAVALAGVMGGKFSGITNETKTIIFESANFSAESIRRTSLKLGLRTDSSARFEKSLDPNYCVIALAKAVELTLKNCPEAKVCSAVVDEANFHLNQGPIELNLETIKSKLGKEIDKKEIKDILERLGFVLRAKKDGWLVTVPTWRATKDISIREDLIEEVVRIFGYENIPATLPSFPIVPPVTDLAILTERRLKEILVERLSYSEVYNYSFVSGAAIKNLGDDSGKYLELDNPLSKEKPFLRRNLLPNLLENLVKNIELQPKVKIFEVGKVFDVGASGARTKANSDELLPRQDVWLAALYADKKDQAPFWQARLAMEEILSNWQLPGEIIPPDRIQAWEHPTRLGLVKVFGKTVGIICEINPETAKKFGLSVRVGVLQLNVSVLTELMVSQPTKINYQSIPDFPEMERDLAILVSRDIKHEGIMDALLAVDPLLNRVELFDVYQGENIGEGYKSMAYHFVYRDLGRTLTTEEVDKVEQKIIKILQEKFGAEVRQ